MSLLVTRGPVTPDDVAVGERYIRFAIGCLASFPFLWLVGLGGAFWSILGLGSLLFLLRTKISMLGWLLMIVPLALFASSVIGSIYFGFQPMRLLGLMANGFVWIALAALVSIRVTAAQLRSLGRAILFVALVQGLLTAISAILAPARLPVPLLSPIAESLPSGLSAFARNGLHFTSWLDGFVARSAGINGQPTWAGAFAAVALIIAILSLRRARGWWLFFVISAAAACVYSIQLSQSRSTWVSLAAAALVILLVGTRRRSAPLFFTVALMAFVGMIVVAVTQSETIEQYFGELNNQREGSSATRGEIYDTTWGFIADLPIPILGFGIKPEDDDLVANVATHSTYLGLIFRGGIIAFTAYVLLLLSVLRRSLSVGDAGAAGIVVLISLWSIFEDMDAGHLVPFGLVWAAWNCRRLLDKRQSSVMGAGPDSSE